MKITVADLAGNRHELEFPSTSVKIGELRQRLFQAMGLPARSVHATICYNGSVCDSSMIFHGDKMDESIPVVLFDNSLFPEKSFPRGVDGAFDFSRPRFSQGFVTEMTQRQQEDAFRPLLSPHQARPAPRYHGRIFHPRLGEVQESRFELFGTADDEGHHRHWLGNWGDELRARVSDSERDEEEEDGADVRVVEGADQELEEDEEEDRTIGEAGQQALEQLDELLAFRGGRVLADEIIPGSPRMERARLPGLNIQLTPDDEAVIERLMEFGLDRPTVVQVYEFSARSEAAARHCLMSMM